MKKWKIAFYVVTGLLSLMMLASSIGFYLMQTETVKDIFETLGFPTFIVIPLAFAKIAGVIVILTRFGGPLVEWAYAGFFFDFVLAASAHINVGDGEEMGAFIALVLLAGSYYLSKHAFAAE